MINLKFLVFCVIIIATLLQKTSGIPQWNTAFDYPILLNKSTFHEAILNNIYSGYVNKTDSLTTTYTRLKESLRTFIDDKQAFMKSVQMLQLLPAGNNTGERQLLQMLKRRTSLPDLIEELDDLREDYSSYEVFVNYISSLMIRIDLPRKHFVNDLEKEFDKVEKEFYDDMDVKISDTRNKLMTLLKLNQRDNMIYTWQARYILDLIPTFGLAQISNTPKYQEEIVQLYNDYIYGTDSYEMTIRKLKFYVHLHLTGDKIGFLKLCFILNYLRDLSAKPIALEVLNGNDYTVEKYNELMQKYENERAKIQYYQSMFRLHFNRNTNPHREEEMEYSKIKIEFSTDPDVPVLETLQQLKNLKVKYPEDPLFVLKVDCFISLFPTFDFPDYSLFNSDSIPKMRETFLVYMYKTKNTDEIGQLMLESMPSNVGHMLFQEKIINYVDRDIRELIELDSSIEFTDILYKNNVLPLLKKYSHEKPSFVKLINLIQKLPISCYGGVKDEVERIFAAYSFRIFSFRTTVTKLNNLLESYEHIEVATYIENMFTDVDWPMANSSNIELQEIRREFFNDMDIPVGVTVQKLLDLKEKYSYSSVTLLKIKCFLYYFPKFKVSEGHLRHEKELNSLHFFHVYGIDSPSTTTGKLYNILYNNMEQKHIYQEAERRLISYISEGCNNAEALELAKAIFLAFCFKIITYEQAFESFIELTQMYHREYDVVSYLNYIIFNFTPFEGTGYPARRRYYRIKALYYDLHTPFPVVIDQMDQLINDNTTDLVTVMMTTFFRNVMIRE